MVEHAIIWEPDELAGRLEASGDYKVLRRLVPRQPTPTPAGYTEKIGIILDVETTGLDTAKDEVIELAMVKFRYSDADAITGLSATFQFFNEPAGPIPAEVIALTGITDQMVAGHRIDADAVGAFVADANAVIAHNADFDRKLAERSWPIFEQKPWACSAKQIDWKNHGFSGAKLTHLLAESGYFHGAHRAIDDCYGLLEILGRPLPGRSATALGVLLAHARRKTVRIWAANSPYQLKDVLKRRGYRWGDGANNAPRAWHVDVDEDEDEDQYDAELDFLRRDIYRRNVEIPCRRLTARERFSGREHS
jgi:DNA polymerase-3 subunit epsilon